MSEGRRWLLCAGVNDYGTQIQFPNLQGAVDDACLIYDTLVSHYNFEGTLLVQSRDIADDYQHLVRHVKGNGSREDIIIQINRFRQWIEPDDLFVFFYAGHGIAQLPGYLVPFAAEQNKPGTYLMYRTLYGELSTLACRQQALFFDCCYAGITTRAAPGQTNDYLDRSQAARVVAYAATSDDKETPDRVPGVAGGRYSPFANAVRNFLLNEVAVGQAVDPGALDLYLKHNLPNSTFRGEVPEVRPGRETFILRRPGLAIVLQSSYYCRVGELLSIDLRADRRGASSGSLEWRVTPGPFGPGQVAQCDIAGESCTLRFISPGVIPFDFRVTELETQESAVMSIEVVAEPAIELPLTLDPRPMQHCLNGQPYEYLISLQGGTPPYTGTIDGLPPGLEGSLVNPAEQTGSHQWGLRIAGNVAPSVTAGGAAPTAYALALTVEDSTGQQSRANKRLLVVNINDYCEISEGEFITGYRDNLDQFNSIRKMLEEHVQARLSGQAASQVMRRMLRRIGNDWGAQTVTQTLDINPGSKVTLGTFYMKKYPVTNAEWRLFVLATQEPHIPPHWDDPPHYFREEESELPIVNITYEQIQSYLRWKGTRLPNAWEWERAARGGDGRLFPWGNEFDVTKCNVVDSRIGKLTPVNQYDDYESPMGVRDMVGNTAEWVEQRIYSQQGNRGVLVQPFRGGSYLDTCVYALTFKHSTEAGVYFGADEDDIVVGKTDFHWVGFRDVIDLDADPQKPQELQAISEVKLDLNQPPVASFYMACYAVSNLEYLEFIQATSHAAPTSWDLRQDLPFPFAHRHLPVVNVSYHDALSFCLWKSRQTERTIRLPTPQQWLAAVDGGENRIYPWGDVFDSKICNSLTSGWGKRLPVFALPEGQSKQGVYNLVGNVQEWVGPPISVKGGKWQMDCNGVTKTQFRVGRRDRDALQSKSTSIGFRYVANDPDE